MHIKVNWETYLGTIEGRAEVLAIEPFQQLARILTRIVRMEGLCKGLCECTDVEEFPKVNFDTILPNTNLGTETQEPVSESVQCANLLYSAHRSTMIWVHFLVSILLPLITDHEISKEPGGANWVSNSGSDISVGYCSIESQRGAWLRVLFCFWGIPLGYPLLVNGTISKFLLSLLQNYKPHWDSILNWAKHQFKALAWFMDSSIRLLQKRNKSSCLISVDEFAEILF